MAHDLWLMMPEIAVLLTAAATLVCDMLAAPRGAAAVSVIGLLASAVFTVPLLGVQATAFSGTFRVDHLSTSGSLVMLFAAAAAILMARAELRGRGREGAVYSLLCFTTLGAMMLAGAGDVMLLVLGVLLSSLGSFALVAWPRNQRATEAALKFFVFGSVSGGVMIFGLTYWFGMTGSTLLAPLQQAGQMPLALALGLTAVIVGLGYKAALVPFHFWAPDAYDGGPVSVAAFLSVVPKIGALFALAQVLRDLPPAGGPAGLVAAVSVVTMTYGNLAALTQASVIRLLAYSSVAQSGYFLLGVVAMGRSLAVPALVLFAAAYAAMNLGAFALVLEVGRTLDDFAGLGRGRRLAGVALVVFLLSLVGIPPLAGFVGKFLLFGAALQAGLVWLAVAAILNSVLSLAVYLRLVAAAYRRRGEPLVPQSGWLTGIVWGMALAITLALGVVAQELVAGMG